MGVLFIISFYTSFDDLNAYAEGLEHLAQASQARALTTVRSLFRFGMRIGYLQMNPAEVMELPKVPVTSEGRFLTRGELVAFLEEARGRRLLDRVAAFLFVLTGLRRAELAGISWCDFFEDVNGIIGLEVHGKGGKVRQVKIRADLWRLILEYRTSLGRGTILDANDRGPLFISQRGGRMSGTQLYRITRNTAKAAGINKPVSPHWLRHSFVTLALAAGADQKQVQLDAGHASLVTTQRYDHRVKQLVRTSVDYIGLEV